MSSANLRPSFREWMKDPAKVEQQLDSTKQPESPAPPPEIPELRSRILNRMLEFGRQSVNLPLRASFLGGAIIPAPQINEQGGLGFTSEPLLSRFVRMVEKNESAQQAIGAAKKIRGFTPAGALANTSFGRGVKQVALDETEIVIEQLMGRIVEIAGDDESAATWLAVAAETQKELDESVEPGFAAGAGRFAGILLNPLYLLAFGLAGRAVGIPAAALAGGAGPLVGKAVGRAGGSLGTSKKVEALVGWAIKNGSVGAAGFGTLGGIEGFADEGSVEGTVEGVVEGVAIGVPMGLLFGAVGPAFRALQRAGASLVKGGARRRLGLSEEGDLTAEQIQAAFRKKAVQSHPDSGGSDAEFARDSFAFKELMVEAKAAPKVTEPTEMPFPERGGEKFFETLGKRREVALAEEATQQAAKVVPPSAPPPTPASPGIGRRGLLTVRPLQEAAAFMKRNFTSAGDLPIEAHKLVQRRMGSIAARTKRIEFLLGDWRAAAKETYKGGKPSPVEMGVMRDFMQGKAPLQDVPKPMRSVMSRFRTEVDAHSRELIRLGIVEGKMAGVIDSNLGVYTTRAYKVFTDPKWAEGVDQRIRNRAKAFLRNEYPNKSEPEIAGLIEQLLFEGKAADSPIAFLRSGKLGSKDLSIFTRRKNIPDEIRELWGEIKDPRELYALSAAKMGTLIENQKFLDAMKEAGTKGGWLRTPTEGPVVSEEFGPLVKRIAADESSTMSPLNGHFTSPEIAKAFDNQFTTEALPPWLRTWMQLNSAVKIGKIVLDNVTQIRNFVGNTGFAIAQGHWASFGKSGIFAKSPWRTIGDSFRNLKGDAWRLKFERLTELGVVHDSARAGELQAMLKDASKHPDVSEFSFAIRQDKVFMNKAKAFYGSLDDFWKVMAFENEKLRYTKHKPNWTPTQVEEHAAGIVRNTYPTYSQVPRFIQGLRRFPAVAPFVSFPSEVLRTTLQSFRLISREMKDPDLRAIGAQRIAGWTAVAGGVASATAASRFMSGTSREDDTALRRFMPEYVKNHQLFHLGANEAGEYRTIDISYNDPHEMLRTPITTFLSGGDEETVLESMKEAIFEFFEPFYNTELLAGATLDLARNKTQEGRPVWNPADDPVEQGKDAANHLRKAVQPGIIRNIQRMHKAVFENENTDVYGPKFKPEREILRNLTGLNIMAVKVPRSFDFNVRAQRRMIENATKILLSAMAQQDITDEELEAAYVQSDKARREAFLEMHLDVKAATGLGAMDIPQIENALVLAGFSGFDSASIVDGTYTPFEPTQRFAESVEESLAASGVNRDMVRALFDKRRLVVDRAFLSRRLEQELDGGETLQARP